MKYFVANYRTSPGSDWESFERRFGVVVQAQSETDARVVFTRRLVNSYGEGFLHRFREHCGELRNTDFLALWERTEEQINNPSWNAGERTEYTVVTE